MHVMIDVTRLRTFRAVVADGSVNRAARHLGYTPSAVSQQIHALQKDVGLQLIERNGRGIVPTPIGSRFAREAEPLLQQASRLETLAQDLRNGRTGSLTISHISSVGGAWMPPMVSTLLTEFPNIRLDLRLWELSGTAEEDVDVAVNLVPAATGGASPATVSGMVSEPLVTEPYVVVMPAGHRLAGRSEVVLADLRDEVWIDSASSEGYCRQIVIDACAACGFTPDFQVQSRDDASAVAFVESGVGITVMPRLAYTAARADPDTTAVAQVVDPTPERTITVSTKESVLNNPAVGRLLELLRLKASASLTPAV